MSPSQSGGGRSKLKVCLIVAGVILAATASWFVISPFASIIGRSTETLAGTSWRSASAGALYFDLEGGTGSAANADGSVNPFTYEEKAGFARCLPESGDEFDVTRYGSDRLFDVDSNVLYLRFETDEKTQS
jgi:hypothetical protein